MFVWRYILAAAACVYLFTVGFLRKQHRRLFYDICFHFGFCRDAAPAQVAPNPALPEVSIDDLVPASTRITLSELDAQDGNVTLLELVCISKLVQHGAPGASFEIGTFDGRTTLNIARNAPPAARTFTLDLPRRALRQTRLPMDAREEKYVDKESSGARFSRAPERERITQLEGDSASFGFDSYEERMECVFIDGSHAANYVRNDAAVALRLRCKSSGIIVFDDYACEHWPDVTRVLDHLHATDPRFALLRRIRGTSLACLMPESDLVT
ncbi:MAG: class I SAM-dependent methyltransferase [Verrucomicrobia bacterium]|nr:class I SAM-dependent methyltransferase [Verrucomicrobiota bacterium]